MLRSLLLPLYALSRADSRWGAQSTCRRGHTCESDWSRTTTIATAAVSARRWRYRIFEPSWSSPGSFSYINTSSGGSNPTPVLRISPADPDDAGPVPKLTPLSRSATAVRSVALVTRFCVSRRSSALRAADESSMADLDLPEVAKSLPPLPVRLVSAKLLV